MHASTHAWLQSRNFAPGPPPAEVPSKTDSVGAFRRNGLTLNDFAMRQAVERKEQDQYREDGARYVRRFYDLWCKSGDLGGEVVQQPQFDGQGAVAH